VSILASRGGSGSAASRADDAAALLWQSQEAMLELDSFQFRLTEPWEGREVTYRVAWQSPDSFHVLYPVIREESSSENPVPVITDEGLYEAIAIGDALYLRQCTAEGEGCQAWQQGLRENVYVPVTVPELEPFWTIELLGLMSDAEVVGHENVEGVPSTRIRGRANVVRAMIQSWRHEEEVRGPLYWGEECTAGATEPGGQTQEDCHETTLDEHIAMLEESFREQDENPLTVEVWIGRDDNLMRRLEFPQDDQAPAGSIELSGFNEVDIQPPK